MRAARRLAEDAAAEKAAISCMPTFQVWSGGQKVDGFEGASETQLRALVAKHAGGSPSR